MPLSANLDPLREYIVSAFLATGGTSTGVRAMLPCPLQGFVKEVGFSPNSLVAGTASVTMAVSVNDSDSGGSQQSSFTQFITSVLGQFSSAVLWEGAIASVRAQDGFTRQFVKAGNALQFTFSGGNAAAIGYTFYAVVQRQ